MPRKRKSTRRGAVSVEFAFVAPLFLIILFGVAQASRFLEVQNTLSSAAAEGGRIGATDRDALPNDDETTTNDLVAREVRRFLNTRGVPAEDVTVKITPPGDPDTTLDLDSPANNNALFEVLVSIELEDLTSIQMLGAEEYSLKSSAVFRNAENHPGN